MTELTVEEHLTPPAPDADAPEAQAPDVVQHWISGEATAGDSTRSADVYDPATGEVVGRVRVTSPADLDAMVERGWQAFHNSGWK